MNLIQDQLINSSANITDHKASARIGTLNTLWLT